MIESRSELSLPTKNSVIRRFERNGNAGLPSQEGGGIGDELTASEEALRFGWASWAIHGLFKKLTDCGDAS